MTRDEVEALRLELLPILEKPSAIAGAAEFQSLEGRPRTAVPVALGVGRDGKGGHALAIWVQGRDMEAIHYGCRIRDEAIRRRGSVDFAILEEATQPDRELLVSTPGHRRLVRQTERLHMGLSIGHADGFPGTLGCFVQAGPNVALLSCCHILTSAQKETDIGRWIHQPGKPDIEPLTPKTHIATLGYDFPEFSRTDSNLFDAAIAPLSSRAISRLEEGKSNAVPSGLGCPLEGQILKQVISPSELPEFPIQTRVGKIGRTSGYTEGTLTAIRLDPVVVYSRQLKAHITFRNVIGIEWDSDGPPFTKPGDSGAVVFTLDPFYALGVHFAGVGTRSYACPLQTVLQTFDARMI